MLGVVMSAVTLLTLFAVSVYILNGNMKQEDKLNQQLEQVVGKINTNSATLAGQNASKDAVIAQMQEALKNTQSSLDANAKAIADLKTSTTTMNTNMTKEMGDLKAQNTNATKEVKSDVGKFTKLNINGVNVFVNKNIVEVEGDLKTKSGIGFGDASLYGTKDVVGMKVGNTEVLKMDSNGNMTVPSAFSMTMGNKKSIEMNGADLTVFGNSIVLDKQMSMGTQANNVGIHAANDIGVYVNGKQNIGFSKDGSIKAESVVFFPSGSDVYSIMKGIEGKEKYLKVGMDGEATNSFQIHGGDKKAKHVFVGDGTAYHVGNLGVGIQKPLAPVHVSKDKGDAFIRMQSGPASLDLGVNEKGSFMKVPMTGMVMQQGNTDVWKVGNDGTTYVAKKLCVDDQCVDKTSLQTVMSTPAKIGPLMANMTITDQEARLKGKQLCINNECLTDGQVNDMKKYMQGMSLNESSGYTFSKRANFVDKLCVGSTCIDETQLKSVLSKLG